MVYNPFSKHFLYILRARQPDGSGVPGYCLGKALGFEGWNWCGLGYKNMVLLVGQCHLKRSAYKKCSYKMLGIDGKHFEYPA